MPGDDPRDPDGVPDDVDDPVAFPAAARWTDRLAAWPRVDGLALPLTDVGASRSTVWAREVLPPVGGTVLDIGCGDGSAALALVPPATEVIGVDPKGVLLDAFVSNAVERGVARRTVHGAWPDVVTTTPGADVVLCHHLLAGIGDIVPFVLTLTERARLAVVAELTIEHPAPPLREAAEALGLAPTADPIRGIDLVAVLGELGLDPESMTHRRTIAAGEPLAALVPTIRHWLDLPAEQDARIETAIDDHVAGRTIDVLTLRWPGAADLVG